MKSFQEFNGKYTPQDYIGFNPFQGEMDVDIKLQKVKLVRTRKEHTCMSDIEMKNQHIIPIGSIARYETALIDSDYFGKYYWCLACIDREIDKERCTE